MNLIQKYDKIWNEHIEQCEFFYELVTNEARYSNCSFADIYDRYHCQFIAYLIFKNDGYEEAIKSGLKDYLNPELRPCEDADHQCHMDCYIQGGCRYDQTAKSRKSPIAL